MYAKTAIKFHEREGWVFLKETVTQLMELHLATNSGIVELTICGENQQEYKIWIDIWKICNRKDLRI
ncbi:hypothetical protein ACFSKN_13890 [Mariniflexile gromovii]|uniref:Uncharacterized protein n=1 Tax=Mariniflexile gromovii TaxID=362523 RepID=A0ABS4BR77_9FLAO|nr:hypothetical protein [Mariniflexile gromovii]MBP0903060.1 hypothetical protein [Mariniflexile gromovii]